jgi:GxxExxY protein
LGKNGLQVCSQMPIHVYYDGLCVGEYFSDLCVEGLVIVEIKTADVIAEQHKAQLVNYLKATEIEVGLLLNFGPQPKYVRKLYTNDRKIICKGSS